MSFATSWAHMTQIAKDMLMRTTRRNPETPPPSLPSTGWRGMHMLGQGGTGFAVAFFHFNETNALDDSLALKVVQLDDQSYGDVENYTHDTGDVDVGADGFVPNEAFCQRACLPPMTPHQQQQQQEHNSVYLRAWAKDDATRRWRLYSEYCVHEETLEALISEHAAMTSDYPGGPAGPRAIPEAAIWHFAEGMVRVAVQMEALPGRSSVRRNGFARVVVHLDIKPDNVFLDTANPAQFPTYPTLKIGDFGSACYTHDADPRNPEDFMNAVLTQGYKPPELWQDHNGDQLDALDPPVTVDSGTNVWQIGKVLMSLMLLNQQVDVAEHTDETANGATDLDDLEDWIPGLAELESAFPYSDDLRDMVRACLHPDITERPSADDLLGLIEGVDAGHLDGMDVATPGSLPQGHANRLRMGPGDGLDGYRDGMAG